MKRPPFRFLPPFVFLTGVFALIVLTVFLLGRTVPSVRGMIHSSVEKVGLAPLADRLFPLENEEEADHHHHAEDAHADEDHHHAEDTHADADHHHAEDTHADEDHHHAEDAHADEDHHHHAEDAHADEDHHHAEDAHADEDHHHAEDAHADEDHHHHAADDHADEDHHHAEDVHADEDHHHAADAHADEDHHHAEDVHADEDHHHHAEESLTDIVLSPTAEKNFGIDENALTEIKLGDYSKSLSFPAIVMERPGCSLINIPSPLAGIVTKIYAEPGKLVRTGEPLFDILLNRPEMIQAQSDYLALLKAKEINDAEITRLSSLESGIAPQKKRELAYEREKLAVDLANSRRVLKTMGLADESITESLEKRGEMIQRAVVYAPSVSKDEILDAPREAASADPPFVLEKLNVSLGQNVDLGGSLGTLSDYRRLVIQGRVFAADAEKIIAAQREEGRAAAVFGGLSQRERIEGLTIRVVENRVDSENGFLYCYADLPNWREGEDSAKSLSSSAPWHFRPGQRCELQIEGEKLASSILLPIGAVASDFGDPVVFKWAGSEGDQKIWRKTPVHLLYKDKDKAIIANDGSLTPGDWTVSRGATFLLSALTAAHQKAAGGGGGIQHGDHVH